MIIIPTLVLLYCANRVYGMYKSGGINKPSPRKTIHTVSTNRVSELHKNIRKNQARALKDIGPDIINDPTARMYAEEIKKMIKPGWENDPVLQELRRNARETFKQRKENKWQEEPLP